MWERFLFGSLHIYDTRKDNGLTLIIGKKRARTSMLDDLQVEPYLYWGASQVTLYQEERKNFFSRGVV